MTIFVNMTAHQLTDEQKETAKKELGATEFVEFKEVQPDLFGEMANSPSDADDLVYLAKKVGAGMSDMIKTDLIYFHLPIGSPAFNFVLASVLMPQFKGKILFSHSERVSKETAMPDGTVKKENVFKFVKFINF